MAALGIPTRIRRMAALPARPKKSPVRNGDTVARGRTDMTQATQGGGTFF
jgi:hypothetical protein